MMFLLRAVPFVVGVVLVLASVAVATSSPRGHSWVAISVLLWVACGMLLVALAMSYVTVTIKKG